MSCVTCKFFEPTREFVGTCHESPFPQPQKRNQDWCGRWQAKPPAPPTPPPELPAPVQHYKKRRT